MKPIKIHGWVALTAKGKNPKSELRHAAGLTSAETCPVVYYTRRGVPSKYRAQRVLVTIEEAQEGK